MNAVVKQRPFLAVIVLVYNGEDFVRDAMQSVLNQLCRNLKFLVLDDGSTDGTLTICQDMAKVDVRVRVVSHANMGLGANRNERCHVRTIPFVHWAEALGRL